MKTVTDDYKNELKKMGKELDNIITYSLNNTAIILTNKDISNVSYHYEGNILKSVMKQLDFETFNEIPKDTELNYKFGIKVGNSYEYIDYGTFIVYQCDKLEDTDTYQVKCYDKMLYSMVDYEDMNLTYPITIKNYLQAICTKLGLTLKDDTFANQDNEIENELYLDSEGNSLGYTFRDVLDEIAQATGSTICINNDDELEVRYIDDAINETQNVEGTSLSLTDTEEAQLRNVNLKGNTTQDGTPTPTNPINIDVVSGLQEVDIVGKNLLPPTIATNTKNGITLTNNGDGSYTLSGTATANTTFSIALPNELNGIYTAQGNNPIANSGVIFRILNSGGTSTLSMTLNAINKQNVGATITNGTQQAIRINNGTTLTNFKIKPMLEKGSTATAYEAFKGNTYSINLGKNLFDKSSTPIYYSQSMQYAETDTGCKLTTSSSGSGFVLIDLGNIKDYENKTLTFSMSNMANALYKYIAFVGCNDTGGNRTTIGSALGNSANTLTTTIGSGYTQTRLTIRLYIEGGTANTDYELNNIQVEKGNATSYSEYFTPIELCKIGTYQDYIYKDNGSWYLHKEIGKVVLDGSEDWGLTQTNEFRINISDQMTQKYGNGFCNYYTRATTRGIDKTIIFGIDGKQIFIKDTSFSTANDFKTWLSTHNTIVYYVLANPTTEEITNSELVSQLNALDKAHTLDGTTNITSTFPLSLTYVSEIETIDEELIKNTRASFDNVYSPINSLVLSRSADSDNIYIQDEDSIEENGLHELKIADNQILNGNNRDEYINEIFEKVNGLTYSYNDFESIGITYLELCDRYKVKVRDNTYKCVMFNDEIEVNNGLNEIIYTDEAEESKTDYTKADKTDRRINQTTLIVDKQQGIIESLVEKVVDISNTINGTGSITLENAHSGNLHYLSIKGNISQLFPNDSVKPSNNLKPIGPTLLIDDVEYTLDIDKLRYVNNTLCDEFVYKDGNCYIIRRVDSNNQALANEVIEERESTILQVNSSSTILLKHFNSAILSCEYLLENVYTDNFATQVDVKSEITQTENSITQKVSAVADDDGNVTSGSIMLAINKDESEATINADKIDLRGKKINMTSDNISIDSNNFRVDNEGNMACNSATINDANITNANIQMASIVNAKIETFNEDGINYSCYIGENNEMGTDVYPGVIELNNRALSGGLEVAEPQIRMYWDFVGDTTILGAGGCYSPFFSQTSLEERKKNFEKFDNAFDILNNVDIYRYHLKGEDDESKKHIGFVIGDSFNYSQQLTDKNNKGVDLYSFISVCCQAIKEQQQEIQELKDEIKKIKGDE